MDPNTGFASTSPSSTLFAQQYNAERNPRKQQHGRVNSISCSYCKGSHNSNRCTVVTDVTARKQIIRAKNRCFNCLKSGHLVRNCNSKNTCFKCKGRHHISLCDAKGGGERNKNNNDGQVPHSQDDEQNQSSNVNVVGCHNSTLLQTANAHLLNTDENSVVFSSCVLFKNCSQKSFITSNAKQRLKLKIIRSEILNVKVFGVKVKIKNAHSKDYSVIEARTLPWKQDHEQIPDNFQNSRNRLTSVFRRLKAKPELLQQYDDIIKQQKRDGIIEQVTEPPPPPGKVHYLPHHYVLKEDKSTTKVRIVYDASSNSPSLNDCLEKGPSLLPLRMDILIRFGTYKVAVASDIKQAFLNVAINTPDRDFLRFLWFDDITKENPQLMIYRYTRVIFGMNASQFLLAASIIKHLEKYQSADPDFVLAFLENLYVDDSIGGGDTSDQVFTFYQKAKARLKEAGLILRKWRSNSPTLQAQISKFEIEDPAPPDEKILGITWDTANDEMEIDLSRQKQLAQSDVLLTKRNILKIIASIYDSVGLVSPLVVPFKIFFQKLCTTVNDWDPEVSEELKDEWNSLIQLFSISSKHRLQRYYFANYPLSDLKDITLHGFCDASKRSYAAVVYIIGTLSSGRSVGRIVCSKTKVSSLNELSIPRLELLSCLLLSSLISCISQSLGSAVPVALKFCWSDSIDALCWVRNNNSSKQFVKNRVTKIRDLTPPAMWRFCPGKLNPADLPSRGVNKANKNNWFQTWTVGPSFIYEDQLQWPEEPNNNKIKITSVNSGTVDPGQSVKDQRPNSVSNKFTTPHSPVLSDECPAICKRTVDLEDHLQDQRPSLRQRTGDVGVRPQGQQPYFSDDIIRCKGRLLNANLPYDSKYPILLPGDSYLSTLIIRRVHQQTFHAGVEHTLCRIRENYWILQCRKYVRAIVNKCVYCKSYPFESTGVDYLGPLMVKPIFNEDQSAMFPVHVALFTCAVTRAVHLDIVPDQSASSFIRTLKRFLARRGIPTLMISDNATCFKNEELRLNEELSKLNLSSSFGNI
ncbi:uncharacterized protein LOC130636893 [Hydractinia symbiolongicarpus]|uniref:uncharacterized protein LOC130636893 n=1 Tax=Hydractinia symbiolongicarpus TaxID=13093 RepID=UPI00254D8E7E|nr:uncharacterized protein LOC130636893 [Hydractinia symbiolongicarpus]